jgi:hypothetical protein
VNWLAKLLGLDRSARVDRDLTEAKAAHRQRIQHADQVLSEAFRKADSILRPYTGPERRRNPR